MQLNFHDYIHGVAFLAEYMLSPALNDWVRPYIDELFDRCEKSGLPIERKYEDVGEFFDGYKIVDFGG